MMNCKLASSFSFPSQIAVLALATAIGVPAFAQQTQAAGTSQDAVASGDQHFPAATYNTAPPKEGFWGHVNPFARKKWVNDRTAPIKGQLNELDEVNAKNSRDIQDVDGRAQTGIHRAQTAAEAANQAALAANDRAQKAHSTALGASGHVDALNATVNGLDQYHQISEVQVAFRAGQPTLSVAARKQLDELATSLTGHQGFVLEIEAHSPGAGSVGIQSSERLAESVKRYLVSEHQIPVYRLHSVALGNARDASDEDAKPIRASSVHIRLMENSLAAQASASPHDAASSTGSERP